MRVSLEGGPALLANSPNFNVSAVDSQTGRRVAGATVALGEKVLGPANAPLPYRWPAPAPAVNAGASAAVNLGAAMTVSAPGYGDALVHYYLVPAGALLPPPR